MRLLKSIGRTLLNVVTFGLCREFEALKYIGKILLLASVGAFLMICTGSIISTIISYFIKLPSLPNVANPFESFDPISLISLCLTIGILEEGMFRYLFYDCLLKKWLKAPHVLAMVISALLFGAAHFNNALVLNISLWYVVPQVIGAAVMGFFFVYLYNKFGLHVAILVHALYDYSVFMASEQTLWNNVLWVAFYLGGIVLLIKIVCQLIKRKLCQKKIGN
jgi:membrane protease YdiL (CAAX protease family)